MADTLTFYVQGSAPEPYRVTFSRSGQNLRAYCTCPAGENGQYCKHRFKLIAGSTDGVVSPNAHDVQRVGEMARGTDVAAALEKLLELDAMESEIRAKLSAAKKALARAMRD